MLEDVFQISRRLFRSVTRIGKSYPEASNDTSEYENFLGIKHGGDVIMRAHGDGAGCGYDSGALSAPPGKG